MRDVVMLFVQLIVTVVRLARPGGLRSVVAESVLVKHQLRILNRGRKRVPNLRAADRILAGLCTLFMRTERILRYAIVLKPSTLLHLHNVLMKRKYFDLVCSGIESSPPWQMYVSSNLQEALVGFNSRRLRGKFDLPRYDVEMIQRRSGFRLQDEARLALGVRDYLRHQDYYGDESIF
jgi:hypothetical protein